MKRLLIALLLITPTAFGQTPTGRAHNAGQSIFDSVVNPQTVAVTGATPSVASSNVFKTNNRGATTITNFVGGVDSQRIALICGDANTVIANNSNIATSTRSNITCTAEQVNEFVYSTATLQWSQIGAGRTGAGTSSYKVATLPSSPATNTNAGVTDGNGASCTSGGGSTQVFCPWSGSSWTVASSSASGGAPAESANVLQKNNGGGATFSTTIDFKPKEPNPYVDAKAYGVRAVSAFVPPAIPGITATISSASNIAVISSASTFQDGDGVVIWGAGASNSMSPPSAPTVTPSVASSETGTLLDVTGPTGATSYSYQIVARDRNGGLTLASTATNISTGQASLGPQSVSISAITLSNNVVTVTTSSAHTLAVGALVAMEGVNVSGGANPFNGWFAVSASADNTHFQYVTMSDSRNGAATTGSSGNAHWWNSNHIRWAHVTGAFQYYIYGRTGGSMALIGVSWPDDTTYAGDDTYNTFDDFGSTLTTAPTPPAYVPSTPPVSATNNMLITTIVSGAGTTSLTLANNAVNTVSGATILFDDGGPLQTAASVAGNNANAASGVLSLPWNILDYVINSPVTLNTGLSILQGATVDLNETMIAAGVTWAGNLRPNGSAAQFTLSKTQTVNVMKAYPGFYSSSKNLYFSYTTISSGNNNVSMFLEGQDIPASTFYKVQFTTGNDHMSMGLVARGDRPGVSSGSNMIFSYSLFSGPQNFPYTSDCTPAVYLNEFGGVIFDHTMFSGRGILNRPPTSGSNIEADSFNYTQAAYYPLFAYSNVDGSNIASSIKMSNVTLDTTFQPAFANLGGMTINATLENVEGDVGATVTGSPNTFITFAGGNISNPGINTSYELESNTSVNDGTFGRTFGYGLRTENASIQLGSGYSLFTATLAATAPTCPVSAGGSVPIGTIGYVYVPVWQNGSEGVPSFACFATTSSGNQTVSLSWSVVPGVKGYDVYRNGVLVNFGGCATPQTIGTTFTDTFSFGCGPSQPLAASGGPAGIQGSNIWAQTVTSGAFATNTNCSSSASPAVCGSAAAGSVAVPTGATPTLVIDTTAVTSGSQILLTIDESLGTKLSVTCNTTLATLVQPVVTARTPGTSFTIQINATLATNPACVSYSVLN